MSNYPISNPKWTGEIRAFNTYRPMPVFDFGKKIYVLLDGQLTAMIPLYVAAARVPTTGSGYGEYHILLGAKVAGRGDVLFTVDKYTTVNSQNHLLRLYESRFFATPLDYARYQAGDKSGELVLPYLEVKDIMVTDFGLHLSGSSEYAMPVQWRFNKQSGRAETANVPIKALWIDKDGSHVELFSEYKGVKFYPTESECLQDNITTVVDFDDETETPEPKEFWVTLPTKVAVTAKTEDEAKEKVRRGLDSIIR